MGRCDNAHIKRQGKEPAAHKQQFDWLHSHSARQLDGDDSTGPPSQWIERLNTRALGNLDKLQFLYLSHNNLTGCIPKGLRDALYHDLALPVWVSASSGRSGPWTSPVCRQ